jgi:LemA protein
MATASLIIILAIALFAIYIIIIFNSLIQLKNQIRKSWANIDVLLKQRNDELPNLVQTVKGYMKHERGLLKDVTDARARILENGTKESKAAASGALSVSLKSLFAVAENYPDLKANQNFLELQKRIIELENQIADRREFYNDSVYLYNMRIQSFPDLILANILKYKTEEMFSADQDEKRSVKVSMEHAS